MSENIQEILRTEFDFEFAKDVVKGFPKDKSNRFIELCQNAMVISFHKYGYVRDGYGSNKAVYIMDSIAIRLDLYRNGGEVKGVKVKAGNTEWLTDVFNYAMIENMCPRNGLVTKFNPGLRPKIDHKERVSDRIKAIEETVALFDKDTRYDRLVSIARYALGEFLTPKHPNAYFQGTDLSPGRMTIEGMSSRKNLVGSVRDFR